MASWPDFGQALVRDSIAAALAACQAAGIEPHPMLPIIESGLAMYFERDDERALSILSTLLDAPDPFLGALARLQYAVTLINIGRTEDAARYSEASLAEFRALGERWGLAMALMLQADRSGLRGDHQAAIAALDEAAAVAREFWVGEDLTQIYGMLAAYRMRAGDLAGARADLVAAREVAAQVGETNPYLPLIEAELARRQGEYGRARLLCEESIEYVAGLPEAYSQAGALGRAALGALLLERGERPAARDVLADALEIAASSRDRRVTATVIEMLAGLALADGRPDHAALLLGAGHGLRGASDEGSYDTPRFRAAARQALGARAFAAAYARGRTLPEAEAVALARP
jgi:tetratricopeptide (TPR) repeat protein